MTNFIIVQKTCTKCKTPKSLSAFSKHRGKKSNTDQLRPVCKDCANEEGRGRYKGRPYAYDQEAARRRYQTRKAAGICVTCKIAPARKNRVHCVRCIKVETARQKALRAKASSQGLCKSCQHAAALANNPLCEKCYLKVIMKRNLGSSAHWKLGLEKLEKQNRQCAYTKEPLILGLNDSIDHIYPVKRFPNQRHDLANFEWVTRQVNTMKAGYTPQEFLSTITKILANSNGRVYASP